MNRPGRVLFVGQAYYNAWYLSRALRELGWKADVLNIDSNPETQIYYHGQDYALRYDGTLPLVKQLAFYGISAAQYDIFHFSNAHKLHYGWLIDEFASKFFRRGAEIRLLKRLGKKIVYTNNGCLDGVSQSSFASWGDRPVCLDCSWRDVPSVCSDERNLTWGARRNELADFQILLGGNRIDYNVDPRVHEVPEFYCLDDELWHPDLDIPERFRLPASDGVVRVYHAVGHEKARTHQGSGRNIKSSHIWRPLIAELQAEGYPIELMSFTDVPNRELRYYQAQADIFADMLTFGFFGATAREAMMLGKPVICYLRPEWLDQMAAEVPDYRAELPIVSATPETARAALVELVEDSEKRRAIGERSREFAVKWHSARAAARRFDEIYRGLLGR